MSKWIFCLPLLSLVATAHAQLDTVDWASLPVTLISDFNAVDANGGFTFGGSNPFVIRGVLLNNPEDMLSSTPAPNSIPFNLGAQWQVFVQVDKASAPTDFGGVAVFMGQNYGNVPDNLKFPGGVPTPDPTRSYTDAQWLSEVARVNVDATTGRAFRAGDLVEIHAQERRFYGGKLNVNENHIKESIADFELKLITPGYGLPTPTTLVLADLWQGRPAGGGVIFDTARATGGERYQGELVRLLDVKLVTALATWTPGQKVDVRDLDGRTFALHIGLDADFTSFTPPTDYFSVTGIFNQEGSANGPTYFDGYELWVMDPATITASAIPEPTTLCFVGLALAGFAFRQVRRRR